MPKLKVKKVKNVFKFFDVISLLGNYVITKFILHNLLGQSIRTSMQNLESVAQKMAELLHNCIIT